MSLTDPVTALPFDTETNLSTLYSQIRCRDDALYIVRMAALPVFLSSALSIISTSVLIWEAGISAEYVGTLLFGSAYMAAALRLRREKTGLMPFVALAILVEFAMRLTMEINGQLLLPIVTVVLTVNGLRGWSWLRHHPEPSAGMPA